MSANTDSEKDEATLSSGPETKRWNFRVTFRRFLFIGGLIGLLVFLVVASESGELFALNPWASWVWLLPVVMLVVVIVYIPIAANSMIEPIEPSALRTLFALISPLIFFVGLGLLILFGGRFALNAYATVAGSATLGTPGWGLIAPFLVFGLPWFFFMGTIWFLLRKRFLPVMTVIFTIMTPLSFALLLGLCVVVHRGW